MRKRIERALKRRFARCAALFLDRRRITPAELERLEISRLLVIRQHNQMGDMLLAVPAFRGLRRRFPGARISLVAAPINAAAAARIPYIDEVLTYAKRRNRWNPLALPAFVAGLRSRRFDAVIVLNTVSFSITSMLLAAASGARVRLGSTSRPFGNDLSARFYHLELPLPPPEELAAMHESRHNLYPLAPIGVREDDLRSIVVPTAEEERDAGRFVAASVGDGTPFVVVHPGAGKRGNIWPPERFAEVVSALHDRRGAGAIAVRGPVDGPAVDAFLRSCRVRPAVVSSPGIGFLASLMKRASCVLCNDTGIMHVAGAAGARCVAVFGPTDPRRWKPPNDTVVAVRARDGRVESVEADEVLEAVERLLALR
jgi:ADP-heptose:LPS heptosyltransferase